MQTRNIQQPSDIVALVQQLQAEANAAKQSASNEQVAAAKSARSALQALPDKDQISYDEKDWLAALIVEHLLGLKDLIASLDRANSNRQADITGLWKAVNGLAPSLSALASQIGNLATKADLKNLSGIDQDALAPILEKLGYIPRRTVQDLIDAALKEGIVTIEEDLTRQLEEAIANAKQPTPRSGGIRQSSTTVRVEEEPEIVIETPGDDRSSKAGSKDFATLDKMFE